MKIKRIIDISRRIYTGMAVWPGDDEVRITRTKTMKSGGDYNLSSMSMGVHTGTHADAPVHFVNDGISMPSVDLSRFIGFVKVFKLNSEKYITADDLKGLPVNEGDIIFFRTSNSDLPESEEFYKDFVYLEVSAAEYLVQKKIKTIGIDYLSVGGYGVDSGPVVHRLLLSNSIGIIEGLCMKDVREGTYMFSGLPLCIEGGDGSPVRAVLMEIEE